MRIVLPGEAVSSLATLGLISSLMLNIQRSVSFVCEKIFTKLSGQILTRTLTSASYQSTVLFNMSSRIQKVPGWIVTEKSNIFSDG